MIIIEFNEWSEKFHYILYYFDDLYIKIERERDYNPIGTGVLEKKKEKKSLLK